MIRVHLRALRPFLSSSGSTVGLRNAPGLEKLPLQRAFASISQPGLRGLPISNITQRIIYRPKIANPTCQLYRSPLRANKRSFHKTSRSRDSKPDPTNKSNPTKTKSTKSNTPEPQGLSARFKKLSREYGWAAVGVYFALSVLDFPFCFLLVRVVGTERIGALEHWVVSYVTRLIPESIRNRWNEYRAALHAAREEQPGNTEQAEVSGWGVEEAQQRNNAGASLGTQLALAYAIHKSFIFLRVPLTAAVTPKVVKVLRSWGWNIGKRRAKR